MPRRPLDVLNLLVALILFTIAVWAAFAGRLATPAVEVGRNAALLAGVLAVIWVERHRRGRSADIIVNFYPIPVMLTVFDSLQPLISAIGLANEDAALVAIDRRLLGGQDATVLLQPIIRPWLSDVMHIAYCTYYVLPIIVGVTIWRRSREAGQRFIFTVVLAFYVSYVGYFLVPARGPRFTQWPAENTETRVSAISRSIYDVLNDLEKTKDDVFPSGHVMIAAVCLIAAYRFDRRLFWWLLPAGVGLCCATVYCRYHYVIDVITGLVLAAVTLPLGYWLYRRYSIGEGMQNAKLAMRNAK